jgi:hypothetical protein
VAKARHQFQKVALSRVIMPSNDGCNEIEKRKAIEESRTVVPKRSGAGSSDDSAVREAGRRDLVAGCARMGRREMAAD